MIVLNLHIVFLIFFVWSGSTLIFICFVESTFRYLQKRREELSNKSNVKMAALSASSLTTQNGRGVAEPNDESLIGAEQCFSILVETGVYSPDDETDQEVIMLC